MESYFDTAGLKKGDYFNPPQYCVCRNCLTCYRNREHGLCEYQLRVGDNVICGDCKNWQCNPSRIGVK